MKEVKKLLVVLVAAVFFIGLFVLCDKYSENVKADYASQINPSIVNQGSSGTGSKGQTVDAGQLSVEENGSEYGDKGLFSVSDSCSSRRYSLSAVCTLRRPTTVIRKNSIFRMIFSM